MPQKKTSRTTSKKTTRKTSSKHSSSRRSAKKPKVYIPAYKAIILCCVIITVCMSLLLLTTLKEPDRSLSDAALQRYREEIVDSKKKTEEVKEKEAPKKEESSKKADNSKKAEPAKSGESSKKSDSSKKAETPKEDTKKKESPKQETSKKTESSKKADSPKPATPQQKEDKKTMEPKDVTAPATTSPAKDSTQPPAPAAQPETKSKFDFPPAKNGAQLIFVFDDGGQNLSHLKPFLNLPFPITVAVLPQITHSKETAAQVRASGNELILHQPMQSVNANVNPGPGAIKPDMDENQIKSILFNNINEIGPVAGFNNHEGSGITADAEKMATVLQFASQEGIYFLDSRTNVETKVPYVARELGYSYYERNIFLDNEKTKENALKELKKGLDLANKNGSVIMIGHIWSADFLPAFLQEAYPELKAQGYTFSTVSKSKAKKN